MLHSVVEHWTGTDCRHRLQAADGACWQIVGQEKLQVMQALAPVEHYFLFGNYYGRVAD